MLASQVAKLASTLRRTLGTTAGTPQRSLGEGVRASQEAQGSHMGVVPGLAQSFVLPKRAHRFGGSPAKTPRRHSMPTNELATKFSQERNTEQGREQPSRGRLDSLPSPP